MHCTKQTVENKTSDLFGKIMTNTFALNDQNAAAESHLDKLNFEFLYMISQTNYILTYYFVMLIFLVSDK